MRRILVENVRRKERLRHGGGQRRMELEEADLAIDGPSVDMLALDEALRQFRLTPTTQGGVGQTAFFAGLGEDDAAAALGISRATASRWWAFSREWLYDRMRGAES